MSHLQSYCAYEFILRHAWLNLLDKHMTTGRINQVAFSPESMEVNKGVTVIPPLLPKQERECLRKLGNW